MKAGASDQSMPRRRWRIGILPGVGVLAILCVSIALGGRTATAPAGGVAPAAAAYAVSATEAIARWIDDRLAAGEPGAITCSDLTRSRRRITIGDHAEVTLVRLQGDKAMIADCFSQRRHRYIPAVPLRSPFETLEGPGARRHVAGGPAHDSVPETVTTWLRTAAADTNT